MAAREVKRPVKVVLSRRQMFGLVGAGRTELLNLVYGATRRTRGIIRDEENAEAVANPADAIA